MKRKYSLILITDLCGREKRDIDSINRLNRVFCIDDADITIDKSYLMECIAPGFYKSVITSRVKDVVKADDGIIIITENSKYYLVEGKY